MTTIANLILGLDIGGTKTVVLLGDSAGNVHVRQQFASPLHHGPQGMIEQIVAVAREISIGQQVAAVGVSIGGPMDSAAGVILGPPHLPGWEHVPLKAMLEQQLGLPVYVEHDARTGALAEWHFGSGRLPEGGHVSDLIFLTLGTGIGAGIITGGRLLHGKSWRTAEAGHWRVAEDGPLVFGKRGGWESYCSGAGIAALAAERFPARFRSVSVPELATLARSGDADAQTVFAESAAKLGYGIALLCDLFVPDVVALGALGVRLTDLLLPTAQAVVERETLPHVAAHTRIVPAALGERIGDVAALCAALQHSEGWMLQAHN